MGWLPTAAATLIEVTALMSLEIVTISDPVHGSRAKVLPGVGFNCYGFSVATSTGPMEVLWAKPDFTDGTAKPSGSGIPLLFPFAGRIGGGKFTFEGKSYELDVSPGDSLGNAIHGFVFNRPWRVKEHTQDRVVGEFQASVDDAALLKRWPADFRITAAYKIAGNTLTADYRIENPDTKPLPFTFGTHPYFRVPLGGKDAEACVVKVPVGSNWELQNLLPTGEQNTVPAVTQLAQGMPVQEMRLDNVFGALKFDNHRLATTVHDPQSGRVLTQTFDDQFTACVVFNPPHREAVCIEPYTSIPDAFALKEKGIDPHLLVLKPGESFHTSVEIRVD
jgi:aldose 1-epimerase